VDKQAPVFSPAKPPPRPLLEPQLSSYSLHFAESDSPVKESPGLRVNTAAESFPPTSEEEERDLEAYIRHQAECDALSPSDLRCRMMARGRWQEPQADDDNHNSNDDESSSRQQGGPVSPRRPPGRTGPAPVPVISKQHSVSDVAKREKLMQGFEVTKYADVGRGKKKQLSYDASSQQLQWRPARASVFSRMKRGPQEVKGIQLQHVTAVRRGVESAALRKAGLVDPLCCLCISTSQLKDGKPRNLDVVFQGKGDRDAFVRGLETTLRQLGLSSVQFS
jgi:hypothetical protein